MAGPTITAVWNSVELRPTAVGNTSVGTRFTTIAWPLGIQNARPAPNSAIAANTGQTSRPPCNVNPIRTTAHSASTA